jgi:hypothetical protein
MYESQRACLTNSERPVRRTELTKAASQHSTPTMDYGREDWRTFLVSHVGIFFNVND